MGSTVAVHFLDQYRKSSRDGTGPPQSGTTGTDDLFREGTCRIPGKNAGGDPVPFKNDVVNCHPLRLRNASTETASHVLAPVELSKDV